MTWQRVSFKSFWQGKWHCTFKSNRNTSRYYAVWKSNIPNKVNEVFSALKDEIGLLLVQLLVLRVFGKSYNQNVAKFYAYSYGRVNDKMCEALQIGVEKFHKLSKKEMTMAKFFELVRVEKPSDEQMTAEIENNIKTRYTAISYESEDKKWEIAFLQKIAASNIPTAWVQRPKV